MVAILYYSLCVYDLPTVFLIFELIVSIKALHCILTLPIYYYIPTQLCEKWYNYGTPRLQNITIMVVCIRIKQSHWNIIYTCDQRFFFMLHRLYRASGNVYTLYNQYSRQRWEYGGWLWCMVVTYNRQWWPRGRQMCR